MQRQNILNVHVDVIAWFMLEIISAPGLQHSAVSLQAGHYLQSRAADLSPVSAVTAVIAAPGSADLST